MRLPRLKALRGIQSKDGLITLIFDDADGKGHHIPIEAQALAAMLVPALSVTSELKNPEAGMQPLLLTAAHIIRSEAGAPYLALQVEGVPIVLEIPSGAKTALLRLLGQFPDGGVSNKVLN